MELKHEEGWGIWYRGRGILIAWTPNFNFAKVDRWGRGGGGRCGCLIVAELEFPLMSAS